MKKRKRNKSYIDYRKYNGDIVRKVCELYEQYHNINAVLDYFDEMDYNVVLSILASTNKYNNMLDPCQLYIDDNVILFNSDPHYGSKYDNPLYPKITFEHAKRRGIETVLIGGDLIEANVNPKENFDLYSQAYYFLYEYPFDKYIKSYAVGGNHDYLAAKKEPEIINILDSRDDIDFMGFKKAYINWKGTIISLQHEINKYHILYPNEIPNQDICFKGHSHMFKISGRISQSTCVSIPASCDDPVRFKSSNLSNGEMEAAKPGFIEAEHFGDHIVVTNYTIEDKKTKKGKEHVLRLK